jgi:hypothetical protein
LEYLDVSIAPIITEGSVILLPIVAKTATKPTPNWQHTQKAG